MKEYVFDIETRGLENLDVICLVIKDINSGKLFRFRKNDEENTIVEGIKLLNTADRIIGHNIIKFDIPAMELLHTVNKDGVFDTYVTARLAWCAEELRKWDYGRYKSYAYPGVQMGKLFGKQSLDAWGLRLNFPKFTFIHYEGQKWTQELEDYCARDVDVTEKLYYAVNKQSLSEESVELEHEVQWIICRQENRGVKFNVKKAHELYDRLLDRQMQLEKEIKEEAIPHFYKPQGKPFEPKVNNKRYNYYKGAKVQKVKLVDFNPGSRDHVGRYLIKHKGWKPNEFTDTNKPVVNEVVLEALPYPIAEKFAEYFTIQKRIGQLAEGKQAWLKHVIEEGFIHGGVNANGTRTGRMTHMNPNLAQVPKAKDYVPYGKECRELFEARDGYKLVGFDAASLELRDLAHYMAYFDGGAYAKTVLEGDPHIANMKAAGLKDREQSKRWFYALIYGAGNYKLGAIARGEGGKEGVGSKLLGGKKRRRFMKNLPAFAKLLEKVYERYNDNGYLIGLDGRKLFCPSEHSALNTLIQGCGAIIMKKTLVLADKKLQEMGFKPGKDYEFVLNIHDEIQTEVVPGIVNEVGEVFIWAIKETEKYFDFNCELDGEYKIGNNWKETH